MLISCHISALKKNNNDKTFNSADNVSGSIFSDESMTKYLQKQLNQQKQLLHLELPSYSKKIIKFLEFNGNTQKYNLNHDDTDDDYQTDHDFTDGNIINSKGNIEMGALPTPASEVAKVAVK